MQRWVGGHHATDAGADRPKTTDRRRWVERKWKESKLDSLLSNQRSPRDPRACMPTAISKGLPSGTPAGLAWRPRGRDPTPGDWNSRPGGRPASSNLSSCNCEVGLGQSDLSTDREDPAAAPASPVPHRTQCTGKPWGPTHRDTSSGGNGWTQTQHRDNRHAYQPKGGRGPQTLTGPYPIAPPQRGIRAP